MKRGRKPSPEQQAASYQARLQLYRDSVSLELQRGHLATALRLVTGFAEDMAMRAESAAATVRVRRAPNLSPCDIREMGAAFQEALNTMLGAMGLWLKEKA